ncbi:MAG: hypothetical protein H0W30_04255 [Gemmatimonadaceae bacterium]|nr:hypothetical protein [Gemmatimonadaceae bacterium]
MANAGTHQLRFYDREGGYLFSSGRKGGGPGEFESLYFLAKLGGDSLLTFDFMVAAFRFSGRMENLSGRLP